MPVVRQAVSGPPLVSRGSSNRPRVGIERDVSIFAMPRQIKSIVSRESGAYMSAQTRAARMLRHERVKMPEPLRGKWVCK